MIARDLLDVAIAHSVETRVADMPDCRPAVLDDRDGQDARHAVPLRPRRRQAMDLIVGDGNRFAHALANGSGLAFEPLAQHAQRHVGRLATGGLSAHTVDDDEQAARFVNVEAILVDLTLAAGVGGAGGGNRAEGWHMANQLRPVLNSHTCPATTATSAMRNT